MITCPLCEHPQPLADNCAVCGRAFPKATKAAATPVLPMPDLEMTGWGGTHGSAPPAEGVPGIEPTCMEAVTLPAMPEGLGIEVDLGRADAVGEVATGGLPELELNRAQDSDAKTVLSQDGISCRYCRRAGRPGSFCEGCGMKLPNIAKSLSENAFEKGHCPACGTRSTRGAPCTDCGVLVPGGEG